MRFGSFRKHAASSVASHGEGGQAIVETALVTPLLIAILVGSADIGQMAYASIEVSNAAHAGAQYGAQNGATASDTAGIATAAADDAGNLTTLTTTSSYSCECSDGSSSTCANTDCANSHIEQTLTVNTSATINPVFHIPWLLTTYTVTGQSIQKCTQ